MSEFHITGDDVYYEGHLVARLLPMSATVRADVVYELEAADGLDLEDKLAEERSAGKDEGDSEGYDRGYAAGKQDGIDEATPTDDEFEAADRLTALKAKLKK